MASERSFGTVDGGKSPLISFRSGSQSPPESSDRSDGNAELEEQVLEAIKSKAFVVEWYGEDDKGDPKNLSLVRKWLITVSLALYALITTFASSSFGAATPVMAKEFDLPKETIVFGCTSLFMIGFALGPALWGYVLWIPASLNFVRRNADLRRPLSECFGRRSPLLTAFINFTVLQVPVIDAKSPSIIFFLRFMQGFFGAAPSSILSGTLADIWTPKQRGFAMPAVGSFLTIGPLLGPLVCESACLERSER